MLKQFKSRNLNLEQFKEIGAALKKAFPKHLVIVSTGWDRESSWFAQQLAAAAEDADVGVTQVHLDRPQGSTGIHLYVPNLFDGASDIKEMRDRVIQFSKVFEPFGGATASDSPMFPDIAGPTLYIAPKDPPFFAPKFIPPGRGVGSKGSPPPTANK